MAAVGTVVQTGSTARPVLVTKDASTNKFFATYLDNNTATNGTQYNTADELVAALPAPVVELTDVEMSGQPPTPSRVTLRDDVP